MSDDKLIASREALAEALCRADDSMYHHERTDDFPCSACKATAATLPVQTPAQFGARLAARFRIAAELVVQDVRAQRGDHIAGLVEDSFAAHFDRAAALAERGA